MSTELEMFQKGGFTSTQPSTYALISKAEIFERFCEEIYSLEKDVQKLKQQYVLIEKNSQQLQRNLVLSISKNT